MSEPKKTIKCIFCLLEKEPSIEHVIPKSVGGVLTINYVCQDCNSELGSKVDSELNQHRHIYDTYLKIKDELNLTTGKGLRLPKQILVEK
jgi:transposase-like protein